MVDRSDAPSPCAGITIVELTTSMVSGPMTGQILADLGGDVIRLESLQGEMMRHLPPLRGGMSGVFAQFNRNKRSLSVDLKSDKGKELAWKLIESADVLIENFRAGVADKIGFGYEAVRQRNERLIYVSVNGFGSTGPYAEQPAYDMAIQGLVGFMPIQGSVDQPLAIKSTIVDKVTAMAAATATLAALLQRTSTGLGQKVEVPMMDAYAGLILPELMAPHAFVDDTTPPAPAPDVYRPIRTRDGHIIGLFAQDKQFAAICRVVGREDLLDDPRYHTAAQRFASMSEIVEQIEVKAVEFTTTDLLALLQATGDIVIAPVNRMTDFFDDPQVRNNGTIYEIDDPEVGRIRQIKPMANLLGSAVPDQRRAPKLGEQSRAILATLGCAADDIEDLIAQGIVKAD